MEFGHIYRTSRLICRICDRERRLERQGCTATGNESIAAEALRKKSEAIRQELKNMQELTAAEKGLADHSGWPHHKNRKELRDSKSQTTQTGQRIPGAIWRRGMS